MPSNFFGTIWLQSGLLAVILIAVVSGAKFTLCGTASFFFCSTPQLGRCLNHMCKLTMCESYVQIIFLLIRICALYVWILYVRIGCVWIICANHLWLICSCKLYVWIVYVRIGCVWIICVLCVNFMWESCVWSDTFFWHYVNHMREMMTPYQIVLNAEQCVAVCCSVLQCVAVCCSVLQCVVVAVCCSVFNIWLFWKLSSHVSEKVFSCVVTNSLMDCTLETPMKSVEY